MTLFVYSNNDTKKVSKIVTFDFFYNQSSKLLYTFYKIDCFYTYLKCVKKIIKPFNHYEPLNTDRMTYFESFSKENSIVSNKKILNRLDNKKLPIIKLKIKYISGVI